MDSSEEQVTSRPKTTKRRDKPQLSCNSCRQKKLKCDRNQPCKNCEKRPLGSCVYVTSGSKTKTSRGRADDTANRINVQNRIKKLENLVSTFASDSKDKQVSFDGRDRIAISFQDPPVREESNGGIHMNNDTRDSIDLTADGTETRHLTASQWEAVLSDITELKGALAESRIIEAEVAKDNAQAQYPTLLFGERKMIALPEVVCSMPPKSIFDELMHRFVKSADIPLFSFHVPAMLKEYEIFWEDPTSSSVSIPWLATLHLMGGIALQSMTRTGTPVPGLISADHTASILTSRAAELLILSDYSNPTKWTIEAMLMYVAAEHLRSKADFKISLIFGILLRLAIREGYHRDPSHSSEISVFEGELRRRVWASITHFDLVIASASGMPPLISEREVNTRLPGNYLDEDLYPEMTTLPNPRSIDEQIWIGYLNFKLQILRMLGKVVDGTNSLTGLTYDEVLKLDQEITAVLANRPPWLRIPDAKSLSSLSRSAFQRVCFLELVACRARIVLHRRFLIPARKNGAFNHSRRMCLTSAITTLTYQNELHSLSRNAEGPWTGKRRFLALMVHDFILAAIVLCLDVDHDLLRTGGRFESLPPAERKVISERIGFIKASLRVWMDVFSTSAQAHKALDILRITMENVKRVQKPNKSISLSNISFHPGSDAPSSSNPDFDGIQTNETWYIPFPRNSTSRDVSQTILDESVMDTTFSNRPGTQIDSGAKDVNFDWAEWDNYFDTSALEF